MFTKDLLLFKIIKLKLFDCSEIYHFRLQLTDIFTQSIHYYNFDFQHFAPGPSVVWFFQNFIAVSCYLILFLKQSFIKVVVSIVWLI